MAIASAFGVDVRLDFSSGLPDIDPLFRTTTGPRLVLQAVACRLLTPRGALPRDPSYGLDIRSWLNAGFTEQRRFALLASVAAEVEKDERVLTSDVTVTQNRATEAVTIRVQCTTAEGPFEFVLNASEAGVAITKTEA